MKCSKCGAELSEDTKFCSYCGHKIEITPPSVGETEIPPPIPHAEKAKEGKAKADALKSLAEKGKDKGIEIWNNLSLYGKVTTVSITVFALLCLVALLAGKTAAVVIAIIQLAMAVVSILMHKGVITLDQKKMWLKWLVLAVAILLIVLNVKSYSWGTKTPSTAQSPSSTNQNSENTAGQSDWSNITLSKVLPEPQSNKIEILYNGDDWLSVTAHDISENDFLEYVRWCKDDYDFTVDCDSFDDYFNANNQEGYCLTLFYTEVSKELSINLNAPMSTAENSVSTAENKVDYADAASFEKALNDGVKVNGKIVQFSVNDYKPDSALGINCWAGEHLNFISEGELDVAAGDIIIGKITEEPSKVLGSWKVPYEVLDITKGECSPQTQKNGFDSATNEVYTLAGYTVEIPKYWKSESDISGGIQRYAEMGDKVAMLQICAQAETDDSYPVTFDGLMDDNDNMISMIESTAFKDVTDYEVIDTGVIKGILYKGTIVEKDSGLTGYGEWFAFASEKDRTWCTLILRQTNNAEYTYTDDFMKMIESIDLIDLIEDVPPVSTPMNTAGAPDDWTNLLEKHYEEVKKQFEDAGFTNISCVAHEIDYNENNVFEGSVVNIAVGENGEICTFEKGEQWPKDIEIRIDYRVKPAGPNSEYEKAFIRDMSDYDLYYMFDSDTNTVVYFGTNDSYIEKGTYTGDFSTGVTIAWSHGEWTETFTYKSGNTATLIDGNGWDWEYKVCDVGAAQIILDGLQ